MKQVARGNVEIQIRNDQIRYIKLTWERVNVFMTKPNSQWSVVVRIDQNHLDGDNMSAEATVTATVEGATVTRNYILSLNIKW